MPPLIFPVIITETESITGHLFRLITIPRRICMNIVTFFIIR
jgi:hypothetical protein